jgi:chaperone modulatory protein CbpM
MQAEAVLALFPDLGSAELASWVERGWVQPEEGSGFHEIDIARVHLIYDLRREMALGEEAVPLVLSLLDQVYELRCTLKSVGDVLRTQPDEVREAVIRSLRISRR